MPGIGTRFGTRGLSIGPHRGTSTTTAEFPAPTRFRTISRAADKMQISEATVESLLNGSSWPDPPTIARVERNLRRRFWASQQYAKQPS